MRKHLLGIGVTTLILLAGTLWLFEHRGPSRIAAATMFGGLVVMWMGFLVARYRLILVTVGLFGLLSGAYAMYSNSGPQWLAGGPPYTKWGVPLTGRVDPPETGTPVRVPGEAAFEISVMSVPTENTDSRLIGTGLIVMAGREVDGNEIPDSLKNEVYFRYGDIYDSTGWVPNGCFAIRDLVGGSVGVLAPYGLVGWKEGPPGSIWGRLYQSPDSTYDVRLALRADRIQGIGQGVLGLGAVFIEHFDGTRVTDAGVKECFEQALMMQREGRGLSRGG